MNRITSLRITRESRDRLSELSGKDDSLDKVIQRLTDFCRNNSQLTQSTLHKREKRRAMTVNHRTSETQSYKGDLEHLTPLKEAPAPVVAIDMKGRFTYVNKALEHLIGYTSKELMDRSFKEFLHPDDRLKILKLFINIIPLLRQPRTIEFRLIHRDGHTLYVKSKTKKQIVHEKTLACTHSCVLSIHKCTAIPDIRSASKAYEG